MPIEHPTAHDPPDFALLTTPVGVNLIRFSEGKVDAFQTGLAKCERFAWLGEDRVVILTGRSGSRSLWRQITTLALEGAGVRKISRIDTPILAADVSVLDGRIVICGLARTGSRVWWLDPTDTDHVWHPLEMPPELTERKGVDALATDGKVLVAIDNIVLPKWMFRYVPCDEGWMHLDSVAIMPSHGPYETIRTASSGDSFFAVHSTTVGRAGVHHFITCYRFSDLEPCASIRLGAASAEYCVRGNTLWVLCPSKPNQVFHVTPPDIQKTSFATVEVQDLSTPCRRLLRSRNGVAWAVPVERALLIRLE